ncbi:hypothetical protein E7V67_011500 [[Empedobacter] haloabium]|uniref:Uncharacterized protein n=1 Tax=[Empedobacter] haloabium TaxID=592317 RepID=A0ABZ1UT30_9BURK
MSEALNRAIETAPEADTPFNRVMKTWAHWMRLDDKPFSTGDANPQDVKELMACGEAVDVMVSELPAYERWAVRKAFGLATVWMFPERSLPDALVAAETKLFPKLNKNVATKRYFN